MGRVGATESTPAGRYDMPTMQEPSANGERGAREMAGERSPDGRDTMLADRDGHRFTRLRAGLAPVARRLRTTLQLIRSNPTGRIALKGFVSVAGALVVVIGIILIPLPGPGWFLVIGGLAIWAVEFHWARRLLTFTRRHVQSWTRWVTRQSWPLRIVIGAFGLIFVGGGLLLSLKYGLGIDVIARVLAYLATN